MSEQSTSSSVSSSSMSAVISSSSEICWDNLFELLLKMVFNNLVGYKEEASSTTAHPILACRQVNKYWKSVAEKLMEPATISALKIQLRGRSKWDRIRVETIHSLIPTLYAISNPLKMVWCPNFLKKNESNPFPSKSLEIVGVKDYDTLYFSDFSKMFMVKLMSGWNRGHNLSSLVLCKGFKISPYTLKLLLQQMPNLKTLQISNCVVVVDDGEKDEFKLPWLSQLQALKVTDNCFLEPKTEEMDYPEGTTESAANKWLVDSFVGSLTLTELEIDDDGQLCLSPETFPNLKSLKLWYLEKNSFLNYDFLPLVEHLSINYVCASDTLTFELFTGFLEKFSSTLVHLEITGAQPNDFGSDGFDYGEKISCNFPNLKFFSCNYPHNNEALQALALYYLPRFPALEKLELTEFRFPTEDIEDSEEENDSIPRQQGYEKEITDFLDRENYWSICSKLVSIHVFHVLVLEKDATFVSYRKQKIDGKAGN